MSSFQLKTLFSLTGRTSFDGRKAFASGGKNHMDNDMNISSSSSAQHDLSDTNTAAKTVDARKEDAFAGSKEMDMNNQTDPEVALTQASPVTVDNNTTNPHHELVRSTNINSVENRFALNGDDVEQNAVIQDSSDRHLHDLSKVDNCTASGRLSTGEARLPAADTNVACTDNRAEDGSVNDTPPDNAMDLCDGTSVSNATWSNSLNNPKENSPDTESNCCMAVSSADRDYSEPSRDVWAHSSEFFFSCLGCTLGVESVWRFPHLMAKNGGGAFLLPYFIFMVLLGIPILYLEMYLGQYTSQGPQHVWLIAPLFGGIGYSMLAVSSLVACYQSVFISWLLYYFVASMSPGPPWLHCGSDWSNNDCCEGRFYVENCTQLYPTLFMNSSSCYLCYAPVSERRKIWTEIHHVLDCVEDDGILNMSTPISCNNSENGTIISITLINTTIASPENQYFHHVVLALTKDFKEIGIVQWKLFLCLVLACAVVFACMCNNVISAGKVAYVTTIVPTMIMIGLLVKSSLLEGASEGVLHFLHPQWERLNDRMVWKDAAVYIIQHLALCYGGIITLASYNSFTYNIHRAATILPLMSIFLSLLAGCLVYASLGHLAWFMSAPIQDLSAEDVKLAFITYPEAMSKEHPAFVAVFYLMLILLCLAKVLPCTLTILATILDRFPKLLAKRRHLALAALIVCVSICIGSIPLTTQGGMFLIEILEVYATPWSVYVLGVFECLVVVWVYKFKVIQSNIWLMIGKHPGKWYYIMWGVLIPLLLVSLLVYSAAEYVPLAYDNVLLSWSANIASWILAGLIILAIPVYGLYAILSHHGDFRQRLKDVLIPPKHWGPSGKFAQFINHQLRRLPDYMMSEKEQTQQPVVWKRQYSIGTSSDVELESISTTEGIRISPPGCQQGDNIDTGSLQWSEDENKFRGNWTGRFDFLISALGYSVGLGNLWRFPYIAYTNGGGAFFVPYLIMFVFCGLPLFYMELVLGQFASVGPITVWRLAPIFKGIGYTSVVTLFLVTLYYNVFAAWSVYYIAASMTSQLPWKFCNNSWNTPECKEMSYYKYAFCNNTNSLLMDNGTDPSSWNLTTPGPWQASWNSSETDGMDVFMTTANRTLGLTVNCSTLHPSPSAEYFFHQVLGLSSGINDLGSVQWHLALCLLFCWCLTFLGLLKGVKSAGKVVYVTVLLPYVIMLILLIRFFTLDKKAHLDGIKYFVTPQWDYLSRASVWGDAATQLFFSLGLCMGGLIALGSHNRFHYNCYRDAYLVCCIDTLTSIFAGFVIFSILGVTAKEKGTDVANVVESSFALAYIVIPDAVTRLDYSTAWSLLFFFMMFFLAVDSQFFMMEAIVIAIMDEFSEYLWKYRILVILTLCTVMFLLGLPFVTQGGLYLLALVDAHAAAWSPLIIGLMQCLAISWVYEIKYFSENIKSMLGHTPSWWWKLMWKYITPAILLFILLFSWIMYKPVKIDNYEYPFWAQVLGIIISVVPILCFPLVLAIQLLHDKRPCREAVRDKALPELEWGPALEKHRIACYMPSNVHSEESIARINEWLASGQSSASEEEADHGISHVSDYDKSGVGISEAEAKFNGNVNRITNYLDEGVPTTSNISSKSLSDSGSVDDPKCEMTFRMRGRSSGLRVTFEHQENEASGDTRRLAKALSIEKSTQTHRSYVNQMKKDDAVRNASLRGCSNVAFDPDSSHEDDVQTTNTKENTDNTKQISSEVF